MNDSTPQKNTTSLAQSIDTQVCAEITKAFENNKETIKNKILDVIDKIIIDDKLELEKKLLEKSKTLFDTIFQTVQNNILSNQESIKEMEQNIQETTNNVIKKTLGNAVQTAVETIIKDNNQNLQDVCQTINTKGGGFGKKRTKKSYRRSRKTRKGRR